MIRFLVHAALTLLANAAGLLVASVVLLGFHINLLGFVVSALFFTGVEILLEPFITSMALKYAPAFSGGIALVTTLVGLLLTVTFTSGLQIDNISTWILAPMIIWIAVVAAGIILPMFMFKKILGNVRTPEKSAPQENHDTQKES